MSLPLEIIPRNGKPYTLDSVDALKSDFDLYHSNTLLHHISDLFRENITARFTAPNEITAEFRMHVLSLGREVVEPFQQTHMLVETPDGWRIRKVISSLGHINWTLGRAEPSQGAFADKPRDADSD